MNQFALKMKLKLGGEVPDPDEEEGIAGKKKTKAAVIVCLFSKEFQFLFYYAY